MKKLHGVFYYVFWGVISLIGTWIILSFAGAFMDGLFAGYKKATAEAVQPTQSASAAKPLTTEEMNRLDMVTRRGRFQRIEDAIDDSSQYYIENHSEAVGLVCHVSKAGDATLYLNTCYRGEEWLFVDGMVIRSDERRIDYHPKRAPKRDTVGQGVTEEFFEQALPHKDVVEAIATGGRVVIRFTGREGQHDHAVTRAEQENMRDMLLFYRSHRGRW